MLWLVGLHCLCGSCCSYMHFSLTPDFFSCAVCCCLMLLSNRQIVTPQTDYRTVWFYFYLKSPHRDHNLQSLTSEDKCVRQGSTDCMLLFVHACVTVFVTPTVLNSRKFISALCVSVKYNLYLRSSASLDLTSACISDLYSTSSHY